MTNFNDVAIGKVIESSPSKVVVGTGTVGTRFIDRDYPNEEGLIAGTTITAEDPTLEVNC